MFKDDWVMNLIRMVGKIHARILGKIEVDDLEVAEQDIGEVYDEHLGIPMPEANALTSEDLIARLATRPQNGVGEMLMLAEMQNLQGMIAEREEDETAAYHHFLKALQVRLNLAIGFDLSNAHLDSNIDELVRKLEEYVLPSHTLQQVFVYFERTTQFDRAEDALWELIDDHITDDDMVQEGLAFYERLMVQTESQLRTGNFSRDEVQQGFDDLWQRANASA